MPIARESKALFICEGYTGCSLSNALALAISKLEKNYSSSNLGFETIAITTSLMLEDES